MKLKGTPIGDNWYQAARPDGVLFSWRWFRTHKKKRLGYIVKVLSNEPTPIDSLNRIAQEHLQMDGIHQTFNN